MQYAVNAAWETAAAAHMPAVRYLSNVASHAIDISSSSSILSGCSIDVVEGDVVVL